MIPDNLTAGSRRPVLTRLMEKVNIQTDGCWLWTGCRIPAGYGQLWIGDRMYMAHRVAYELFVGSIPEGLVIDHLCRVTGCVNPAHLEVVTYAENTRRGTNAAVIAANRAAKTHCKAGHPFFGSNVYSHPDGYRVCRACRRASQTRYVDRKRQERAS